MKVFISQSGPKSLALGQAMQTFVRRLIPGAEPWLSPTGIEKGTRWISELTESLEEATAGLICLTPHNLTAPWILFEAGVLSHDRSRRVWTFLLDVRNEQVGPQMGQFQATGTTRDDVLLMMKSMNERIATAPRTEGDLEYTFNLMWPELAQRIQEIQAMPAEGDAVVRPVGEMVGELLGTVREIGRQSNQDSWRIAKTLAMLGQTYRQLFNSKAPSMKELMALQRAQAAMEGLLEATSDEPGMTAPPMYSDTPLPLREAARSADGPPTAELKTEPPQKQE
jgi:hypothetical protein